MAVHQSLGELHVLTQAVPGFLGLDLGTDVQPSSRSKLDYPARLSLLEPTFTKGLLQKSPTRISEMVELDQGREESCLTQLFGNTTNSRVTFFLGRGNNVGREIQYQTEQEATLEAMCQIEQFANLVFSGMKL